MTYSFSGQGGDSPQQLPDTQSHPIYNTADWRGMGEGSNPSSSTQQQHQAPIDYQALFQQFQAQQLSQSSDSSVPHSRSASRTGKERAWPASEDQQQQQQLGNGLGMQNVEQLPNHQGGIIQSQIVQPSSSSNGGTATWQQDQQGYNYAPTPQDQQRFFGGGPSGSSPGHQRQTSYEFQDYRSRVSLSPQPPPSPYRYGQQIQQQQQTPQQGYYLPSPSRSPLFPPTHSPSFTNSQLQPFPPSPSHFPHSGNNSRSHSPNFPPTLAAEDFSLDLELDLGLDLGSGSGNQDHQLNEHVDDSVDDSGWGFPFAGAGADLEEAKPFSQLQQQQQQSQGQGQGQTQVQTHGGQGHGRTDSHSSSFGGSVPPTGFYGSDQSPQSQHQGQQGGQGQQQQQQGQPDLEQGLLDLLGLGQQQGTPQQQSSQPQTHSGRSSQNSDRSAQGQSGDMVYRDLMAGPGSLLLPSAQNQQRAGQMFSQHNQQGQGTVSAPSSGKPGQVFFPTTASTTSSDGIIYGEPGSFNDNAPAPSGNLAPSQTIAPPLVQRRIGKNSLGALKEAYAGIGGANPTQSQFARRMNSESSETDESIGGSSRRGTGDSMSLQSGGYDPYVSFQHQQRQGGPQGSLRPQPPYMSVASPLSGFSYAHLQNPSNGPSSGSNKPQSPPQLIIPDSPMAQPAQIQQTQSRPGTAGSDSNSRPKQPALNTLFPPPNPQIPYGAYLPNMSPIGPGGPSINIVPSTPTSALKEGVRGIWEKMAIQAAQANRAGGGENGGMMQVDAGGQALSAGLASGYGSMGRRRASHAGIFAGGRPQITPDNLDLSQPKPEPNFVQPVPDTAPPGSFSDLPTQRPAQYQAHRQRSRSESHINAILPTFAAQMGQEEMQRLILESWMNGGGSAFDQSQGMGEMDIQNGGDMDFSDGTVPVVDPMALNPAGSIAPSYNVGQQQLMEMPQFSPFPQGNIHSAPAWQNSHVVPGPETYGANFIMTNDGRRIEFGGVGQKGMPTGASQMGSLGGQLVPASPARSDDSWTMEGAQALEAIRRSRGEGQGHRRNLSSEDFGGQYGQGQRWLSADGNDTADFLDNIVNPMDGSLLPPGRGSVSHPRPNPTSTAIRRGEASPYRRQRAGSNASSISAASASQHQRSPSLSGSEYGEGAKPVRTKVTTPATEMASKGRRMNDGQFLCPVPGCGSTFTRHFNLKGHLRSHNEERPFECTYPGCTKSFARKHDCNRHMQLHVGLKPFVCEGCQRTFARLDALSRHHKTEAGIPCSISHPLPTNPDGSLLSESKYRAEMARRDAEKKGGGAGGGGGGGGGKGGKGKKAVMM